MWLVAAGSDRTSRSIFKLIADKQDDSSLIKNKEINKINSMDKNIPDE